MPPHKPRHAITEPESVARALAVARRWRSGQLATRLLTHLIDEALRLSIRGRRRTGRAQQWIAALTTLSECSADDYLDYVRAGWGE